MFNFDYPYLLLALVVLNWPVYRLWGSLFFANSDDFATSIYYWLVPDVVSLFRGEWSEDQWAELKLGCYLVLCALCVACEYGGIVKLIELFS